MLKTGDILLIRSKGFLPWCIRRITGGYENHSETAKETDMSGELYLQTVGARGEGVVPMDLVKYLSDPKIINVRVVRYNYITDTIKKEIYRQMVLLEGSAGYDYTDLFWNYLKSYVRFRFTGKWKWSGNKSKNKFACWQLSQYFHQTIFKTWWDARIKEFTEPDHDIVFNGKPEDLCELLSL